MTEKNVMYKYIMPYIYCLSNPAMPGLIKIGAVHINGKTVKDRAIELYSTGVPNEFHIEFFAAVSDSRGTESKIHSILDTYRHNRSREFFSITVEDAKHRIEQHMPELVWGDIASIHSTKVSKSAYNRLSDLHKVVSEDTCTFIDMIKKQKYYDEYDYDSPNENMCNMIIQRLQYIHEAINRMNDKEAIESPYRTIDNAYMKKELHNIQCDLEKLKDSIKPV